MTGYGTWCHSWCDRVSRCVTVGGLTRWGKCDMDWIMSTKGSQPRQLNRDDERLGKNWSQIKWSGKTKGTEGKKGFVKTRIVYGEGTGK